MAVSLRRPLRVVLALGADDLIDLELHQRLFGLAGNEGNHGEDVKEVWWYLDLTPTHSWMRWRFMYPQAGFPYDELVSVNRSRGRRDSEFELLDTGVFDEGRCWEITADYHAALGPGFRVECLTGSGVLRNLEEVAAELSDRLVALFVRDPDGRRSVCGGYRIRQEDPAWHDQILFHEYFHADTGAGLGASHQTGWTGIVADLIINKRERTQQ